MQGEQGAPTVGRATPAALAQSAADPIMHSPVLIGDAAAGSAGWLWLAGWLCFHGGAAASTGWAPQSDGGRQLLLTAAGAEIDRRWGRCTRVGGRGQRAVAAGGLAGGKAMAKESSQVSQESGSAMQPAGWRGLAFSSRRHLSVHACSRLTHRVCLTNACFLGQLLHQAAVHVHQRRTVGSTEPNQPSGLGCGAPPGRSCRRRRV